MENLVQVTICLDVLPKLSVVQYNTLYSWMCNTIIHKFIYCIICNVMQQILVGDSMGALLALHTCIERPQRIKCILGVATAADLPERLFSNYPGKVKKVYHTSHRHFSYNII